jgi:hypothetical protein
MAAPAIPALSPGVCPSNRGGVIFLLPRVKALIQVPILADKSI